LDVLADPKVTSVSSVWRTSFSAAFHSPERDRVRARVTYRSHLTFEKTSFIFPNTDERIPLPGGGLLVDEEADEDDTAMVECG